MTTPCFARHETFHPRCGWLKKGYDVAEEDPRIFTDPEAHVRLGVGKNMVRAIRYWCHAFKVLEHDDSGGSRPSEFGRQLLGSEGHDPYLEDLGSLWLLHWNLLQEPDSATAWRFAFFEFARTEFSIDELTDALSEHVKRNYPMARAVTASLRKDASCIVRMYAEIAHGFAVTEETIHCPFTELGILRETGRAKTVGFRVGPKPGLSPELIAALSLEYAAATSNLQTIALSRLAYDRGSPGLAFKLTEATIYAALEAVCEQEASLTVSDTAGITQLAFSGSSRTLARRLVAHHFRNVKRVGTLA